MNYRISDLMDGYADDEIHLEEKNITSAEKIKALTMNRLPRPTTPLRRGRKLGRVLLAAALVVLILTATAFAVYQYSMKDTVMESMPDLVLTAEQTLTSRNEMSLNGFSDSPEYQAYVEWETWLRTWESENLTWFSDHGVDDSWHETPDNYCDYYGAYTQEQGEKLEAILDKYGLTPHTALYTFNTESQLCAALGMDDLFGDDVATCEGYLYDDGSFNAQGTLTVTGQQTWVTMIVAVHGSFTRITYGMPETYEEWSYTTASGREVLLAVTEEYSWMVVNLDGCFVHVELEDITEKDQVEALVEQIDLEELNTCFATASARQQTKDTILAWQDDRLTAVQTDNANDAAEIVLDVLGNYYLADRPEGYALQETAAYVPGERREDETFSVTHEYGPITLCYRTLKSGETALEHTDPAELNAMGFAETDDTVNGYDAIVTEYNQGTDGRFYSVSWLDTDRELVFTVEGAWSMTKEEVIALAESVTAEDPQRETGAAAYESRAAQYQEEIAALVAQAEADYQAYLQEQETTYRLAVERLGDYSITALDEGYEQTMAYSNGVKESWYVDEETGECIYDQCRQDVQKYYEKDNAPWFGLMYVRKWSVDDETVSTTRETFERMLVNYTEDSAGDEAFLQYATVNGRTAFVAESTDSTAGSDIRNTTRILYWLDMDCDLIFRLYTSYTNETDPDDVPTVEELVSLAESVQ
jgi:hypothetical protein